MCSLRRSWTCQQSSLIVSSLKCYLIVLTNYSLALFATPFFSLHLAFIFSPFHPTFLPFFLFKPNPFMRIRGPCAWEKVRRLLALSLANHTTLHWLRLTNGNVGFLIICFLFVRFCFLPYFLSFSALYLSLSPHFPMDGSYLPKIAVLFCRSVIWSLHLIFLEDLWLFLKLSIYLLVKSNPPFTHPYDIFCFFSVFLLNRKINKWS